jgi:hypothetical protein
MSVISNPAKLQYNIDDFTTSEYVKLIRKAKLNYRFIKYEEVELGTNFILWRHDCDFSLNRALRIAQIEQGVNIASTYFLNPHCDFYNILEKTQSIIIEKILNMGHSIGLHFDATYYDVISENQLDDLVAQESEWIQKWFGVELKVFSFHNPTDFLLSCEKYTYGGLINCYSSFFKKHVPYCSDSNGYWRFRRLADVLEQATDSCLQVLTHPGWWQETAMLPRDRVVRAIEGRAAAGMRAYDDFLESCGRVNAR